jgi:hypothetical protein
LRRSGEVEQPEGIVAGSSSEALTSAVFARRQAHDDVAANLAESE